MDKAKYEEMKQLEFRIKQLEITRDVLKSLFDNEPFSLEVKIQSYGSITINPFFAMTNRATSNNICGTWVEDIELILSTVTNRIKELKNKFDNG